MADRDTAEVEEEGRGGDETKGARLLEVNIRETSTTVK